MIIKIISVSFVIWIMMYVWVKIIQKHEESMKDVDSHRMKYRCGACKNETCELKK